MTSLEDLNWLCTMDLELLNAIETGSCYENSCHLSDFKAALVGLNLMKVEAIVMSNLFAGCTLRAITQSS